MKKLFLLACILNTVIFLQAQEVWDVEKCLDYALKNNTSVVVEQMHSKNAESQMKTAKFGYYPTVNGFAYHDEIMGISTDTESYGTGSAGLSAEVDLFHGFANKHKLASSRLAYEYSLLSVKNKRVEVGYAVGQAYLLAAESSEMKAVIQKQIELTIDQLDQIKIMVDAGEKPVSDLLKVQLQLSNEKMQLADAENIEKQYLQDLTELLRLPVEQTEGFAIDNSVDKWADEYSISTDSLYMKGLANSPLVQLSDKKTELTKMNVKQVKTQYYPHLTASYSIYSSYSGMLSDERAGHSIPGEMSMRAGLNLSVPIFNRMQTKQHVADARISVMESELQAEETKLQFEYILADLYVEYQTSLKKYKQHKESLGLAKESFRLTQAQYDAGGISLIEYNIVKNQLAQEELSLSRSKYQMVFQKLLLKYYMEGALF